MRNYTVSYANCQAEDENKSIWLSHRSNLREKLNFKLEMRTKTGPSVAEAASLCWRFWHD